jgi:integrase/recombinase XerC
MSRAEQIRVLKVSGEHIEGFRDHVIISLALGTGLRESELAALNVGDVASGPKEIRTKIELVAFARKGGPDATRPRQRVFVPKLARRKLEKYLTWKKRNKEPVAGDAALFLSNRGDRIAVRTMRHLWRTWQKRARFEHLYTFHELRHTSLTNLYAATKDVLLVQKQARHASVTTTQIYAHVSDDNMRDAVEELIS